MRESVRALVLERLTEYIRYRHDPACVRAVEFWEDTYPNYGGTAQIVLTVQYLREGSNLGATTQFGMSLSDMIQNLED